MVNSAITCSETAGYKQTSIGLIPKDWEVKKLGEIGTFSKGKGILKNDVIESGFPCIRYGEIYTTHNYIIKNFKSFINETIANESQEIFKGDILFAGSGETIEDIGKCVAYMGEERAYAGGDIIIFKPHSDFSEAISYTLETDIAKRQKRFMGQGNSIVHLYSSDLQKLKIPIPPLPEQQKIAEILSTFDEAINVTKQIIEELKGRNIGLAQQLLSGKMRLKGYEKSQWHLKSVDEVALFKNGKAHENCIDQEGDYFVVNSKFISTQGKVAKASNENLCPLFKNDIVMVMSDIPNGKAFAKCFYIPQDNKYTLNQRICALTAKKGTDSKFLYYQLNRNNYYLAFNNGVSQTNLKKEEVLECPLVMPDIEEQLQIVKVIDIATEELKQYEQKLETLQLQKKGLMQQLLTGKTRVNI
jgi:type I restriction enzyme S subunit